MMISFKSETLGSDIGRSVILSLAAAVFLAAASAHGESPQTLVATQDRGRIIKAGNAALGLNPFPPHRRAASG